MLDVVVPVTARVVGVVGATVSGQELVAATSDVGDEWLPEPSYDATASV